MTPTENRLAPEHAEKLVSLLNRFRQFRREPEQQLSEAYLHAQAKIADFLDRFRKARTGPDGLDAKQAKWEAKNAPHFNVFRVVRLQRRETKLHSPILAEFLKPSGIHGQGFKFLDAFFHKIYEIAPQDALALVTPSKVSKPNHWEVITERGIGEYGRLDISLACHSTDFHFQAVIENKVDASEGEDQLFRYFEWLEKKNNNCRQWLIFLTPDGRSPETAKSANCIRMSYREDIAQWLKGVLAELEAPWLRATVEQYLEIVKDL